MYKKFEELFGDYYQDTLMEICMVPAFDAMELAVAILSEITQEVELRANEIKDHATTKEIFKALSYEADQITKENQRLTKVLEESKEV